jgi:hypothetical protein
MQWYGRSSLHEFLADFVVFRNLVPVEPRLPPLDRIAPKAGMASGTIPRKSQPEYGAVIAYLLQEARLLTAPGTPVERLIFIGDTRLNDGTAFANICQAGGWPGSAFIGADRDAPPRVDLVTQQGYTLYVANRWAGIAEFDDFCSSRGLPADERTAIIIDIDKTALGARGRNDQVIDRVRVEAVRWTVGELLGDAFDPVRFQAAYDRLNQPEYHPFTADNQDYLAYVCLILGAGAYDLEVLLKRVQDQELSSFAQFIAEVDGRSTRLPDALRPIHDQVYALVGRGDPTPFKAFRYNEYRTTVARMGQLDDDTPVGELLREEIVITQDVRRMALEWRERGALLFGLSDKPDEASLPSTELAAGGSQAIHRTETHIVGP